MSRSYVDPEYSAASCEGKEGMPARVARKVAARMKRKHKTALEAYRCDLCGDYHVGAQPPRTAAKRRAK